MSMLCQPETEEYPAIVIHTAHTHCYNSHFYWYKQMRKVLCIDFEIQEDTSVTVIEIITHIFFFQGRGFKKQLTYDKPNLNNEIQLHCCHKYPCESQHVCF
jgi:hypothetical protein